MLAILKKRGDTFCTRKLNKLGKDLKFVINHMKKKFTSSQAGRWTRFKFESNKLLGVILMEESKFRT